MKVKKIIVSAFMVMALGMVLVFPVFAEEGDTPQFGNVDISINEDTGFIIETTVIETNGRPTDFCNMKTDYSQVFSAVRALPDQETSKVFSHNVYDRNNKYVTTIISTVKGMYSQVDSVAEITSISAYASGGDAENISLSTSKNGADGYIKIYFLGTPAGTIHYKIYTNGNIVDL